MKIKSILRSSKADASLPAFFPGWFDERFGEHYSQISVDTTLKLKSACKDVSRAMRKQCSNCSAVYETTAPVKNCATCGNSRVVGYVPADIEELTKKFMMPPQGVTDFKFVMGYKSDEGGWVQGSSVADHSGTDEALLTYIERYPEDWEIVKKSLGLARQKGRHACAFVIANKPIHHFIPLTSVSGVSVTSFTAPAVEAVGGLKMDFLVINSLRDIQDCISLVQERSPQGKQKDAIIVNDRKVPRHRLLPDPKTNQLFDVWDLPEDQDVFKDVSSGRTETVFQFNTPGAVQWLANFNYTRADGLTAIRSVEDMAAFTALDRPGPLDVEVRNPDWTGPADHPGAKHNMLVEFARRARGAKGSPDVLAILEELVPETYGVMCYQEQLQRVYQNLTSCTGSEAETFRTDVSKKQKEKVEAAYPFFMERASVRVGAEDAQKLWDFIKTWAQYGFNKSHAVSYAVIGYACAWLKHHYPLEWWCAVLRNATKEEVNDKFWRHCSKYVSLPDIKLSKDNWVIEGDRIRAPISLLHGVGEKAHEQLCRFAPYTSIEDLAGKIIAHRAANAAEVTRHRKNAKTGETVESKGMSLGRSPLQRGIIHRLIVAGAMDSLFEKDADIASSIDKYDVAIIEAAQAEGAKYEPKTELRECWKRAAAAYKKASKEVYPNLDPLSRYQTRKSILPAYGTDLKSMYRFMPLPECLEANKNKKTLRYLCKKWDRETRKMVDVSYPVIAGDRFELLNTTEAIPDTGYRGCVLAYIEERRLFNYGENKSKEALELTLEISGARFRLVHWPDNDGSLPKGVETLKKGCIIAAMVIRNKPDKPFSIRQFTVLRDALGSKTDSADADEGDE